MKIDIQNTKIDLIQWLTILEDPSILQKIMDLRKKESKDWWNETSDAERTSIEKGLSDAANGHLKPHSEAEKIYGKYL